MSQIPAKTWSNISATPSNFVLESGMYQLECVATFGGGSITLNVLGPDGTTLLSMANVTANGGSIIYLADGTYQLTIATATGVYAALKRVNT